MAVLIFLSVSRFYFVNLVTRITHFYSHFYSLRYNKALFLNAYSCACMCSLTCIYTCNHTFKHFIRMFAPYRVSAYVGTFVSKPLNLFSQTLTYISTHICIQTGVHICTCKLLHYIQKHLHKCATHAYLPYTLSRVKNGNTVRMTIKCINMRNE